MEGEVFPDPLQYSLGKFLVICPHGLITVQVAAIKHPMGPIFLRGRAKIEFHLGLFEDFRGPLNGRRLLALRCWHGAVFRGANVVGLLLGAGQPFEIVWGQRRMDFHRIYPDSSTS